MTDGKHRHPATVHVARAAALIVALAGAGAMLSLRPSSPAPAANTAAASQELTLEQAYPAAQAKEVKTVAADGSRIDPLFFLSAQKWVGTAPGPDNSVRLLLITNGSQRELRKLPKSSTPEFAGFVADGDRLLWMELTARADGTTANQIWASDSDSAKPRMITADTGDAALYDKRDDMAVHDGKVSWISIAPTESPTTQVRTVSLSGGKVEVQTIEGAFTIVGWPWISSINTAQDGPVSLRNLTNSERVVVPSQPNELITCSPQWCRAVIIGSGENTTIIEVFKPNATKRIRTVSGNVGASTVDVGALDRFELYTRSGGKLMLYDLQKSQLVTITSGAGQVAARGPVLWWSTGDNETLSWHALDLRSLTPQ